MLKFKAFFTLILIIFVGCGGNSADSLYESRVTFHTGGGTNDVQVVRVTTGQPLGSERMPADPILPNLRFDSWMTNANTFDQNTVVSGNINVSAVWKATVTFDTDGGSPIPSSEFVFGDTLGVHPTQRNGFIFSHWVDLYTNITYTENSVIRADITLTAIWRFSNLTFDPRNGNAPTQIQREPNSLLNANTPLVANPAKPLTEFLGWNTRIDGTGWKLFYVNETDLPDVMIAGDMTFYALWRTNVIFEQIDPIDGSSKILDPFGNEKIWLEGTPIGGGNIPFPEITNPMDWRYSFKGWNTRSDGEGTWLTAATILGINSHFYSVWNGAAANHPILIHTAADLQNIKNGMNMHYELANDIDINFVWYSLDGIFTGTLNGKGYEIRGLQINEPNADNVGLFQTLNGQVKNLGIVADSINGKNNVGILAGRLNSDGTVSNVYVTGGGVNGNESVGAIAGLNGGTIENSYSTVNVTGFSNVGGIAGTNNNTIRFAYAGGEIRANESFGNSGGIAGINTSLIERTAAINPRVQGQNSGRIAYFTAGTANFTNNFALSTMLISLRVNANETTRNDFTTRTPYVSGMGWDFERIWQMPADGNGYPVFQKDNSDTAAVLIYTAAELANIEPNKNYLMMNDIHLPANTAWTPISQFRGTFDGGGYTITGLRVSGGAMIAGLFASVDGGTIRNLKINDATITISGNSNYAGIMAGLLTNGAVIENCAVQGRVSASGSIGGIIGGMMSSAVKNSIANVNLEGNTTLGSGGIAGYMSNSFIQNAYHSGDINVRSNAGGIAGSVERSNIKNSYSVSTLFCSADNCGGIAGAVISSSDITNNYFQGTAIRANNRAGGIVGNISDSALRGNVAIISESGIVANSDKGEISGSLRNTGTINNTRRDFNDTNLKNRTFYEGLGWQFGVTEMYPWVINEGADFPNLFFVR